MAYLETKDLAVGYHGKRLGFQICCHTHAAFLWIIM